jgi:hypothetical protein
VGVGVFTAKALRHKGNAKAWRKLSPDVSGSLR